MKCFATLSMLALGLSSVSCHPDAQSYQLLSYPQLYQHQAPTAAAAGNPLATPTRGRAVYYTNPAGTAPANVYGIQSAAPSSFASPLHPIVQGFPLSKPKVAASPAVSPALSFDERNRLEQEKQLQELQKLIDQQQASFKAIDVAPVQPIQPAAQPAAPAQPAVQITREPVRAAAPAVPAAPAAPYAPAAPAAPAASAASAAPAAPAASAAPSAPASLPKKSGGGGGLLSLFLNLLAPPKGNGAPSAKSGPPAPAPAAPASNGQKKKFGLTEILGLVGGITGGVTADPNAAQASENIQQTAGKFNGFSTALQKFGKLLPQLSKLAKLQKIAESKGIEIKKKSDQPEIREELSFQ